MNISGNRILITGGCSGIGLALAREFLKYQNTVIVCDNAGEKIEHVKQTDPNLHAVYCDVNNSQELDQLIDYLKSHFNGINILINNAGVIDYLSFFGNSSDNLQIEHVVKTNLIAPLVLARKFLPILHKEKDAAIINMGSALAFVSKPTNPVYCATKAALHSATKSLRAQLKGKTHIKVFEILPPTVNTGMTKQSRMFKLTPEKTAETIVKKLKKGNSEIAVGYTTLLRLAVRLFPRLMDKVAALPLWVKEGE